MSESNPGRDPERPEGGAAAAEPPTVPSPRSQPPETTPGSSPPEMAHPVPPQPPPPTAAPDQSHVNYTTAEVGKIRSTGVCILLYFVTFGIYGFVWFFMVHDEMKRHARDGIGGVIALLLAVFVGIVMPYLTSNEVGTLYERRGQERPVTALTGLWYFPGIFILVGPFIWFAKTNGALNDYWRSVGVREA